VSVHGRALRKSVMSFVPYFLITFKTECGGLLLVIRRILSAGFEGVAN
jgi:hypothetical protein